MADYSSSNNYVQETQRGHPPAQTVSDQPVSDQCGVQFFCLGLEDLSFERR